MRTDKENEFSSFSKLLTKIDTTNLGQYELKVLKQEHQYLDRLRHQRVKIQELKRKYDDCQAQLNQERQNNNQLSLIIQQKCQIIQTIEGELQVQRSKRQGLQKKVQKTTESDKQKLKIRIKQIQHENQELKKIIRQKQLIIISMQEQHTQKLKKYKDTFQIQRRSLLISLDQKANQMKYSQNQLDQLKNLVSRQNKALKSQNEKIQKLQAALSESSDLSIELEQVRAQYERKCQQCSQYQERLNQMHEQLENAYAKLQKQDSNNRLKGQLDQIRRKMGEMQKGEIQRIQFIVNELE